MIKRKIFILILLASFLLSSCAAPVIRLKEEAGSENAAETGTATGTATDSDTLDVSDDAASSGGNDLDDTSDVTILENYTGGNVTIAASDLGSTTFNICESNTDIVSETFTADGPEKSIQLRDDDRNITWKLTVPEGALLNDTDIKMTLLYNISGSEQTGTLDCGVMLEPDGLQFIKPAVLTAEGDYEHAFAYAAKQDGSNLNRAFADLSGGSIAIQVSHFSMYAIKQMTQEEFDKRREAEISKAEATLAEAIEEAKLVLKEPITILPLPTWSKCLLHDEESKETKKAYDELDELYVKLASPEYLVLQKMQESRITISQCLGETNQPYKKLWNRLSYRLYQKAVKVLKEYGPNKETIVPAINISYRLLRDASSDSDITKEEKEEIYEMAGRYAIQAGEAYMDEVIKNHDYCSISAVWGLARAASSLNHKEYENSSIKYERIINSLKFKYEFDGKIVGYSNRGNHTNTYTLNAKIPDIIDQVYKGKRTICNGTGKVTDFVSTDTAHMEAVLPAKFEISSFMDFHYPCEEESTVVYIDKPAPLSMTYYQDKEDGETLDMPFFESSWRPMFQPHLSDDSEMYHIEIKMVNGQASNKLDMTNSLDFGKIEYQFNLEHIPK